MMRYGLNSSVKYTQNSTRMQYKYGSSIGLTVSIPMQWTLPDCSQSQDTPDIFNLQQITPIM